MRPDMKRHWWIFLAAPLGLAFFVWIGGELVMQLWNWLLPPLLGWPRLTFWQALGLLALCRILFGGWSGGGRSPSSRIGRRLAERMDERWEERLAARWESMSPEEREWLRHRCERGFGAAGSRAAEPTK